MATPTPFDPIIFPGCAKPTLGVEIELSLVERASRELVPRAAEVLAALAHNPRAKAELFRCTVELTTSVCADVGAVRADLLDQLRQLRAVCAPLGLGAFCAGTHPLAHWRDMALTPDPRYQSLAERMAWPARRLLICGTHIHVGVKSGEHAIALTHALSVFLPHFLALSASSPYWQGIDTGMASARTLVFEGMPTAGLPPELKNWNQFAALMRTFLAAGSVRSIREIWWDIRPHLTYGTVELRICDGVNSLDEICALAAFMQALVDHLQNLYDDGAPLPSLRHWTLRENKWRAARFGLEAALIRNEHGQQVALKEHIELWLQQLLPNAEALGSAAYLRRNFGTLSAGAGCGRQRQAFAAGGSLAAVVDMLLAEMDANVDTNVR